MLLLPACPHAASPPPAIPHAQVHIGDTVRLGLTVSEGKGKTRTQRLEGVVIAQSGSGSNTTVTVRRVFQGVGVEMNFHLHSPVLGSLEVLRRAKVRCFRHGSSLIWAEQTRGQGGQAGRADRQHAICTHLLHTAWRCLPPSLALPHTASCVC